MPLLARRTGDRFSHSSPSVLCPPVPGLSEAVAITSGPLSVALVCRLPQSGILQAEVDKVNRELIEWQRLIEHQRAAINLQETKVESAASTVDVVTQRHDELDDRCQLLERDIALKDKAIAALHDREQNAHEQIRAVEHLHHRSQKSNAELEAKIKARFEASSEEHLRARTGKSAELDVKFLEPFDPFDLWIEFECVEPLNEEHKNCFDQMFKGALQQSDGTTPLHPLCTPRGLFSSDALDAYENTSVVHPGQPGRLQRHQRADRGDLRCATRNKP